MSKLSTAAKHIIGGLKDLLENKTARCVVVCRRCNGTGKVRNPAGTLAMTKCKTCKGVGRWTE